MSLSTMDCEVAIVGAGLTGAALALALSCHGRRVVLIDRAGWPQFDPERYDLRVSAFNRASENLFRNLGVWQTVLSRRAYPFTRVVAQTGVRGAEVAFSAAEIGETHLGHMIENSVVVGAMAAGLEAQPHAVVLLGENIESVRVDDARAVIETQSGKRLRARLVVGADGPRSMMRSAFGITGNEGDYAQRCIVATIWFDGDLEQTAWQRFLDSGPLGFLPLARGTCSLAWSAHAERADHLLGLDDRAFIAELERACDGRLGTITAVGRRAAFPLRHAHARRYIDHRFALIGDAAHVVHPLAGLGANLGLADAAVLAEVLNDAGEHQDPGQRVWLRKYERRRHGENEVMLNVMDGFNKLFSNDDRALAAIRNSGLRLARLTGPLKLRLARRASGLEGDLPATMREVPEHGTA